LIVVSLLPIISGSNIPKNDLIDIDVIIKTRDQRYIFGFPPMEEWNYTFGGIDYDCGSSVQQTADGGFIISGYSSSFGAGNYDIFLIKTDSNGTTEWDKTFGGSGGDICGSVMQTDDGGFILAGGTSSYGAGSRDVWLIKTNADGNKEWSKTFGGANFDSGESVQQTTDGGYIIIGRTESYGGGMSDVWLIKTDSAGNKEWDRTFGGGHYDYGWSGEQTTDGGYIITGLTESYGAHGDYWIIKTDNDGYKIWDVTFGTIAYDSAHSIQQTIDGGYIIAGFSNSYGAGWYDIWLIKMDSNGTKEWDETYGGPGGDTCGSVMQTIDGGYIIAGGTYSYGNGGSDAWIIKADINGNEKWNKTFGGTNFDFAASGWQTADGGYIVTGRTGSYGSGDLDLWLIKIDTENNPPHEPTNPFPENNSVSVDVEINLSWTGGDPDGDNVTYDVYFGNYNPPPKVTVNQIANTYNPGTLDFCTTYYWQIVTWDDYLPCKKGPIWSFTTNCKPDKPEINGPTSGSVGTEYTYTFNSADGDDDDVYYYIKWGDGHYEIWKGPYASGEDFDIAHTYDREGTFTIEAKAKDLDGAESDWAEFTVSMPRNKVINRPILNFLQSHPNLFQLLQKLLQLGFGQ
jgi:hypothetical protein